MEQLATEANPNLRRLRQQYQAALARTRYIDELPDPRLGANLFGDPIETAAGSQRANMSLSQTIPWLGKLDAEQRRACLEALATLAEYRAERLRVLADLRIGWYRLYVIDKQVEIALANQKLLKSLIEVANAKLATGKASQGDVLLGSVELAQLDERLLTYQRQRRAVVAELNRLTARPAATPVDGPDEIDVGAPDMSQAEIYQLALQAQPEIEAARLRVQATRWGVEVARLSRRPELTLSASYFFTDDNRPPTSVVDVGEDPWAVGAQISLPLWREKYDAMRSEAAWKHQAAHSTVEDLSVRFDAMVLDLLAEARRAAETASLYESTILPQARQTLRADQQSYATGNVEFDRVIRNYRNLLTLELGFHNALGELAVANAQLRRIAGVDFALPPRPEKSDDATAPEPPALDQP